MWRKTLALWKITLFDNLTFTLSVALTYFLLNFLFLIPLINAFNFFVESLVTFGLLVCISKLYVNVRGDVQAFRDGVINLKAFHCIRNNILEAVALSFAHILMGIVALFLVFLGIVIIALITGTSFLLFNDFPPLWVLTIYLIFLLLVYFSIVTSYPFFFARVIFEAKIPKDYFLMFVTSPFSKLLFKMSFSLDLLISSIIIGFISLILTLLKIFITWLFPFSLLFVSFFVFINILLIYLFGVVAVGEFVWKGVK